MGKISLIFKKVLWITLALVLIAGVGVWAWQQNNIQDLNQRVGELNQRLEESAGDDSVSVSQYTSEKGVEIEVFLPQRNQKVASPVIILGSVPGNWSFEASFPVVLKDASGKVVATSSAQLLADWMTSEMVPFSAKLEFTQKLTGTGSLVLKKDNPSGMNQNEDSLVIPVRF